MLAKRVGRYCEPVERVEFVVYFFHRWAQQYNTIKRQTFLFFSFLFFSKSRKKARALWKRERKKKELAAASTSFRSLMQLTCDGTGLIRVGCGGSHLSLFFFLWYREGEKKRHGAPPLSVSCALEILASVQHSLHSDSVKYIIAGISNRWIGAYAAASRA